jgi:hypothetical protein
MPLEDAMHVTVPPHVQEVRAALRCGRSGCPCRGGATVHCPAHDDGRPSLTVNVGRDGRLLVHCQTGCTQRAVIDALRERGLWRDPHMGNGGGMGTGNGAAHGARGDNLRTLYRQVALYQYRDATGRVVAEKARFEAPGGKKTFRWRLPGATDWNGLQGQLQMRDLPLWGAEQVAAAPPDQPVYVCEGEKAVEACRAHGLLAVCHGGGAGTTDFGDSLEVLRGRVVYLWPDNDEPGRRYMARLYAALRPIARRVTVLQVPVREQGDDAWDYFHRDGGTVEELTRQQPPERPYVEHLAHDAVRVVLASPLGQTVRLTFSELEKTSRSFDCELEVVVAGPAGGPEPYSQRINLASLSQKTELRRELDVVFGREHGWASLLTTAFALARDAYLNQDRARRYVEIVDPGEPQYLCERVVPAGVPTIWFGDGSAGKTYLALSLGLAHCLGEDWCGLRVQRGRAMLIDYENTEATFRFRVRRLLQGLGYDESEDVPFYYWPARGIPLPDQVDALRRAVERLGITLLIVDSAAPACGAAPEEAESAMRYFNALAKLGDLTTLTVAHITKGSDTEKPFGSAFWHHLPRRTWYVERVQEEESDQVNIGMYPRKVNDGRRPRPIGLRLLFCGEEGLVMVEPAELTEVPGLAERLPLRDQVLGALRAAREPLSAEEIAEVLRPNASDTELRRLADTVGRLLRRMRGGEVVAVGEEGQRGRGHRLRYGLAAPPGYEDLAAAGIEVAG